MRWSNFVNFLTNKSKTFFANVNTATVSLKCKMVGTLRYKKQSSEIDAHVARGLQLPKILLKIVQSSKDCKIVMKDCSLAHRL